MRRDHYKDEHRQDAKCIGHGHGLQMEGNGRVCAVVIGKAGCCGPSSELRSALTTANNSLKFAARMLAKIDRGPAKGASLHMV